MAIVQDVFKNCNTATNYGYNNYSEIPKDNRLLISPRFDTSNPPPNCLCPLELTSFARSGATSFSRCGIGMFTTATGTLKVVPVGYASSSGFPDGSSTAPSTSYLGDLDNPWTTLSVKNIERPVVSSTSTNSFQITSKGSTSSFAQTDITWSLSAGSMSYGLRFYYLYSGSVPTFGPVRDGTAYLGSSNLRWVSVYSQSGTIQTSDRSAKSHIHYLDETPVIKTRSVTTNKLSLEDNLFTTSDMINFIKKLNPATFVYKQEDNEISPQEALQNNNTEAIQLGLIADDIKDEELFNYVGATMKYNKEVTPAEVDEEGNTIKEAVTEEVTTLGLKPIPLAVLALTACKNLIQRVEELEEQIKNK